MRIVAFMQNLWVRDPERVLYLIARHGENYRRRLIAYALFAGCASGRRLKATFGDELCRRITWEEASREITGNPEACPPADPVHIANALKHYKPDIVICFGHIAGDAVEPLWRGKLIGAPHPAARQHDTMLKLGLAADALRNIVDSRNP
jgi:hypothetical protein